MNRLNMFWGLGWKARPSAFEADSLRGIDDRADLVIGCVDSRAARKTIEQAVTSQVGVSYWLDLGNNAASGQYVLGQPLNGINRRRAERLRTVAELYPEIADPSAGEDPLPSCSAAEALERQEPFINQTLAASALAMLGAPLPLWTDQLSWGLLQRREWPDERLSRGSRAMEAQPKKEV